MTQFQFKSRPHATTHVSGTDRRGWRRPVPTPAPKAPAGPGPVFESDALGTLRRREARLKRSLAVADGVAAMAAVAALLAWIGVTPLKPGLLVLVPLIVGIHKVAGLYDRDELVLRRSTLDEVPTLLQLSGVFVLLVALAGGHLFLVRFGAQQLVVLWLLATGATAGARAVARTMVRRAGAPERCLVIGDADHVRHIREKLHGGPGAAEVVAAIEVDRYSDNRITRPEDMRTLVERHDLHRVVIAPVSHDSVDTVELVRIAKAAGIRVSILPRVLEAVGSAVEFEQVDGMTMLGVRRFGLTRSSMAVKRAFDLAFGSLALLSVSPLLAGLALAVRLDSPGPVFFRQTRIGRDGKPFRIWKFRSMAVDAEARKRELLERNEAGDGLFKLTDDPRVTRVGRFLRRTSLDELPQIFNVLSGEMSLVGPRPLVVDEDARVVGMYRARLHLTPGMTGPWQVLGSTRVPMDEMVGIDYLYVANWSLWQDIKLILRTVPHMLLRRGL